MKKKQPQPKVKRRKQSKRTSTLGKKPTTTKTKAKPKAQSITKVDYPDKKVTKLDFSIRHGSGDLVQIQISARLKKIPKGMVITSDLLRQMVREKAEGSRGQWTKGGVIGAKEGPDPPGIELKIIRWRNPDRKNKALGRWRSGPQSAAWGSLRRVIAAA